MISPDPTIASSALLHHLLLACGPDVVSEWKAGGVRYSRDKRLFAIVKPLATRVDVGFMKFGRARSKRILSAKGKLPFLLYLVEVEAPGDVDTELRAWLRESYDLAGEPASVVEEWRARLRREGIFHQGQEFDLVHHVSLRPAFPPDYDVPGLVAVTFRLLERENGHLVFATGLNPAAAIRLGERLGLDAGEAFAMVDSHERMHIWLQLAGVSEESEEDASRFVDAVWLSLRHPRAAHLIEDRDIALVSRVGPGFWERLIDG